MALCDVHFFGESIQKHSGMGVVLPDGDGPFPVLYLLHGLSDDYTSWHRRTSIEWYVRTLPLIVVMPDGHRGFYVNDPRPGGCAYEDHIVKDVVGLVDRTFPTIPRRGARATGGLSMGGYGAMMLAMRHPEMFSVACSHSGAFHFTHGRPKRKAPYLALAEALPKGKYDCFALARKLKRGRRRLAIRFDCGVEDGLLQRNREFHAYLAKLGLRHEYAEYPGAHNWGYWDQHIQQTLEFVVKNLRVGGR
jgi:putative tributyrin esterase